MPLLSRVVDPAGVTAGRTTGLLAVLWATGGALTVAATLAGGFPAGDTTRLLGVGGTAVIVGLVLLALRERVLTTAVSAGFVVLGTVAITLAVLWAGPVGPAAPAVLYVYVAGFSFVSTRAVAPWLVALAAVLHLGVLLAAGYDGGIGQWLLVWGVAIVTGVVLGEAVEAGRRGAAIQRELAERLREADATKTALLSAAGHDLSGPLTALVGLADTLTVRGEELDPDQRIVLGRRLAEAARRLQAMLDELLRVGQLETGRVPLRLEQVAVDALVDRAVDVSGVAPGSVRRAVPGGLEIVADPGLLSHALANLLTNAARYGGGEPVTVGATSDDGIVLWVDDRGPGIPDEHKERVFEPFERARDEDAVRGSGLGLWLVRRFAELHGGTAWAQDAAGGGTRACIRIPRTGDELAPEDARAGD